MKRFIIAREQHLCVNKEPLMLANGSLSFHGMKTLDSLWRQKESNRNAPILHILKESFANEAFSRIGDNIEAFLQTSCQSFLSFEKPTFFLFFEDNLHWIPFIAYEENKKIHVFIFDPAPLNAFPWASSEDKDSLETTSTEDMGLDKGMNIIYYRNEALFKSITGSTEENDVTKEVCHLSTDSGCGVFAWKLAHQLFSYKDLNLNDLKRQLVPKVSSNYEAIRGVSFSFQWPKSMAYLSHHKATYLSDDSQKRKQICLSPYNTTLKYYVEKYYTQLKDFLVHHQLALASLNRYMDDHYEKIAPAEKELKAYLIAQYQENPAFLIRNGEKVILPLTWNDLQQLNFNEEEQEQACIEYYQNRTHSALRYLLREVIWEKNSPAFYLNPWHEEALTDSSDFFSSTKIPLSLIALLYLIADKKIHVIIQGHQFTVSKDELVDVLALFARENNQLSSSTQIFDNLLPDSPAKFFEAEQALLKFIDVALSKPMRVQVQEDLNEFAYQAITKQPNFFSFFKKMVDSQPRDELEERNQFNFSAVQIEEFISCLKHKYRANFAWDSEFFIRKQFVLESSENHFSKFYTPVFENRYLDALKQQIQDPHFSKELNIAHARFNQYVQFPICLRALIKEELSKQLNVESTLALIFIAYLENNRAELIALLNKIKEWSQEEDIDLFSCSDAEIAHAILKNDPASLRLGNRQIKEFINAYSTLLDEVLNATTEGLAIDANAAISREIVDLQEPRQRLSLFSSPLAKRRRIEQDLSLVNGVNGIGFS